MFDAIECGTIGTSAFSSGSTIVFSQPFQITLIKIIGE